MRYFYDTEFIEDGRTIDLISIGIVADDGRELYLVNGKINGGRLYQRILKHAWLMEHVIPSLPLTDPGVGRLIGGFKWFALDECDVRVVPPRVIRNQVREFIGGGVVDETETELWAWYGAYDHVALAQLFGPMDKMPPHIPQYTHELQQYLHPLSGEDAPQQKAGLHNALEDARHVRDLHAWATQIHREFGSDA